MLMSKHSYSKNVLCPFYKYEGQQLIYCEGVVPGSALHLAFDTKGRHKAYRETYCENCYKKCMITQMLNRKYDYE